MLDRNISVDTSKEEIKIDTSKETKVIKATKVKKEKKKSLSFFLFISLFIIIILLIIFVIILNYNLSFVKNKLKERKKKFMERKQQYKEKLNDKQKEILRKDKTYIKLCVEGTLLYKELIYSYNITQTPNVSIIISAYNSEKAIKYAIRSIQNQSLKNLEIIVINDNSNDKTLLILEQLQKEDPRIKIITNEKNKGTFNSRITGVLNSRSKYITFLDSDDMFCSFDILETVFNEAEKNDTDMIGFGSMKNDEYDIDPNKDIILPPYSKHKCVYVTQPKLSEYSYYKDERNNLYLDDVHTWAKLIRRDVYMKVINALGEERCSKYVIYAEDTLIVFLLYKNLRSYKYIDDLGILYYSNPRMKSYGKSTPFQIFIDNMIFYVRILFEFSDNTIRDKLLSVVVLKGVCNHSSFKGGLNEENKKNMDFLVNDMYNSSYIEQNVKEEIKKLCSN